MNLRNKNLIKDFGYDSFVLSGGMQGGGGVAEDLLTTKGDTHGYTTENARVAIGTDGQILTADSTVPLGLAWETAGGGVEYSQITTATTFTPTTQTGLVKVSVDNTDLTAGNVDINVDGSSISNTNSGIETRIINPVTSLSIVTHGSSYDLSGASYDSVSFSFASEEGLARGMTFKTDGTKMYIIGTTSNSVYQYSLSTAWDLSTASYDSISFSANSQDTFTYDVHFKTDGLKMYIMGATNDKVFQYTLSTAWDISTASYDSVFFSVPYAQEPSPNTLDFKTDGTKMYILGSTNNDIYQYSLSTAWDVSTASYDTKSFDVTGQTPSPTDILFKSDGTKLYVIGSVNNTVYQYSLSTTWDISTASYDSVSFSVATQVSNARGMYFKTDGSRLYVMGLVTDKVFQYSTTGSLAGTVRVSVG